MLVSSDVNSRWSLFPFSKEKMSALNGQRLANLKLQRLQGMQTSQDFDLFFESVKKKVEKLDVEEPSLPRKRPQTKILNLAVL